MPFLAKKLDNNAFLITEHPLENVDGILKLSTVPGYFAVDGEHGGLYPMGVSPNKVLVSKGIEATAQWESVAIYNETAKTSFSSQATQDRQITFPDKSGNLLASPLAFPASKNNLVNSDGASLSNLETKLNALLDFLRDAHLLAYPNIISSPISIPGVTYWDTLNSDDFIFEQGNQNVSRWSSKVPPTGTPLYIEKQLGVLPLEQNIFNSVPGVRFGTGAGASINFLLNPPYTIFMIYKADMGSGYRRAVQALAFNFLIGPYNDKHSLYHDGYWRVNNAPNNGNPTTIVMRCSAAGLYEFYINGVLWHSTYIGNIGNIGLGCYGSFPNESMMGWFKCFGVASKRLDDNELSQLHDFLLSNI